MATLSNTPIPFNATCWLAQHEPDFKHLANRVMKHEAGTPRCGRSIRDSYGRYLINLKNVPFDQAPLKYLDWLSGQHWVYGEFRLRLTRYLTHPVIAKELNQLFQHPDDGFDPLFTIDETAANHVSCKTTCPRQCRWHGQSPPKEDIIKTSWHKPTRQRVETPDDSEVIPSYNIRDITFDKTDPKHWTTKVCYVSNKKAWDTIAEAILFFEEDPLPYDLQTYLYGTEDADISDQPRANIIKQAIKLLPHLATQVTEAFNNIDCVKRYYDYSLSIDRQDALVPNERRTGGDPTNPCTIFLRKERKELRKPRKLRELRQEPRPSQPKQPNKAWGRTFAHKP